ncbi:hypothetical protein I4U23_028696 [Adineta vaga]|nr:hypothetical protein I4U23_028696 [Adineta vaga]
MLKAGLLPSPTINALSSNVGTSKNKIDTQTFVELRSDIPHVRIYFSVDGTKPDPFQIFKTGHVSTYLYRGAFRLGPGRRVVKAMAVTTDGLRESNITTKYFDVDDKYSEAYPEYPEYSNEYPDNDQSFNQINLSPERSPPLNKTKKPRHSADHRRSNSANQARNDFGRTQFDDGFNVQSTIEGPISPVNYAGTQINIWGSPGGNMSDELMHIADPSRNYGYMTEQMLERIQPSKNLAIGPPQITDVAEQEDFWDRKPKPVSPGNGNWKKTLEHLFLNIYNYVKDEQELRELFGWKKFGRIETAKLIDKGNTYQIITTFKKPLGEQSTYEEPPPIQRPRPQRRPPKRNRTPPDTPPERPVRPVETTPPPTPPPINIHSDESINDKSTARSPRIYTEEIVQQGTLVPFAEFNVQRDCENLRKAMKGLGTDDDMLVHILGNRSSDQRVKIRDQYKILFGRRAVKGAGTDEEALIEILASRSNKRIKAINDLYPQLYSRSLEKDIVGDTSGHLKKILVTLAQGNRPETNEINEDEAENDAKTLYEAGEKKWGTDESKFVEIIADRSNAQLKAICDAYSHYSKKDIEKAIESETSGNLRRALLAIVRVMRSRPGYFAQQLKKALKGMGTNEDELNRVIISRCEVDMIQIKEEYESLMKRSLEKHVHSDTSGSYRNIIMELLKNPNERTQKAGSAKYENVELPGYKQPEIYKEDLIQQGTMTAKVNFNAGSDADALRKAMKGLGTDEKTLIDILGNRTTAQRLQIKSAFKDKHNRDLVHDLKSETSGNFANLLERLMMDPVELDCFELKQGVKGLGTDEETLIEILASRSNERLKAITETYQKMYGKPLEKDVKSDTSGDFRRLLVSLMQGSRPETTEVNVEEAKTDAQTLIDAGQAKFGTDEARFNVLFCSRSDPQLRAIFNEFAKLTGKSVEDTVKSETSGDLQKGLMAIIRCVRSRPYFFAEQLRKAMKGLGTKESTLNRILITRSEIDLVQIKEAFSRQFNRELEQDVSKETSGDYKKLLLEILKDPSKRN